MAAFIDIVNATKQCYKEIHQAKIELILGNNEWNELAAGFINGVSNELSQKQIKDLGKLIIDQSNAEEVATEILQSQVPYVVLASIGVVLAVLTLIGSIGTCIWACTCRRSSKGVSSSCVNIAGLILTIVSFLSVAVGAIMFCNSSASFTDGVRAAPDQLHTVLENVEVFANGATNEISCSIGAGLNVTSENLKSLPKKIFLAFKKSIPLMEHDYVTIEKKLREDSVRADAIYSSLDNAISSFDQYGDARSQVNAAIGKYQSVAYVLGQAPQEIAKLGVLALKQHLEKTVHDNADPFITKTRTETIPGINGKVNEMVQQVKLAIRDATFKANHSVNLFYDTITEHDALISTATSGLNSLIILPCIIALFTATIAFLVGFVFVFQRKSVPSKGCCSASCTLITLSVLLLAMVSFVAIAASVLMTVGYGTGLVCKPFFYDGKLEALQTIDEILPAIEVQSMTPGVSVPLKLSAVMKSCEDDEPFLRAVKGDQLIDPKMIEGAFNRDQLLNELTQAIDALSVTALTPDDLIALGLGLQTLSSSNLTPPLNKAQEVDGALINPIIKVMTTLNASLKQTLSDCQAILKSAQAFKDANQIKTTLKTTASELTNNIYDGLVATANNLTTSMLDNSASCLPVYRSYKNVGDIACQEITGGVQGMWAAAGLTALSLISTVIAVFCIASVLRSGKGAKEETKPHTNLEMF
ncbi:hypothetical protein PFISCL1PPCAC_4847 [Pristionchus fissidentatus]|uniref:Uncharacterized protein n=1 Tax=Pristionchus fissidentatus TaxID=1538716 RepID=A0AAV5V1V8_9BILA|nr:hypothetical protein PFISCL1PPCAC_4847 [Pristionchus fissidentatus]